MKNTKYRTQFIVAALSFALLACAKKEEPKTAEPVPSQSTATTEPDKAESQPLTPKAEPTKKIPDANADYVRILATHKDPQPTDPVVITIAKFSVTKASFDPANLEDANAEIVLDLPSLASGIEKRDNHLKSADYLDVKNTPQVVIKISDVKKSGDAFAASALVVAHGITKTLPVTFKVIKSDDKSVQVEASKVFDGSDFGITTGENDMNAPMLTIEMRLTFDKG